MVDKLIAKKIVSKAFPDVKIKKIIKYKNKWILYAPTSDPLEGDMDPFYYVDVNNGDYGEFCIILPENREAIRLLAEE